MSEIPSLLIKSIAMTGMSLFALYRAYRSKDDTSAALWVLVWFACAEAIVVA